MRAAVLIAFSALGACRCQEDVQQLVADIVVDPAAIDFSRAPVGQVTTATLVVGNRGTARLVLSHRIEPDGEGFTATLPDAVGARLAEDAVVRFVPPARGTFSATLIIVSNDPDTPELRVPLSGEGGPPILQIDPNPVDLGLVNEGPGASRSVALRNVGFDTLGIAGAALDDGRFELDASSLPTALLPGEEVRVTVSLQPNADVLAQLDAGVLRDRLRVTHLEGEDTAPVSARVNLAPIAIAVEMITRRHVVKLSVGRPVTIDGSETVDPEGDPFSFVWAVTERPAGSITAPIGQGQPTTRVVPDAVGSYRVVLRAIDEHGAFSDADVEILPRDLALVLRWTTSASADCRALSDAQCAALPVAERQRRCCGQSDLDLHLIRPGGSLGDYGQCPAGCDLAFCAEISDEHLQCRQEGSDCAYANRSPEWFAPGRNDDPRLDVDDVRGDGPEIITLDAPADGSYRAVVHYCLDRIGEPTLATVEVLVEGAPVATSGPVTLRQGDAWTAFVLVRDAGAWQLVPSPLVEPAPAGLCGM